MSNTIERKKKKGGVYQFFIADEDGKIIRKLDKKYYYGYEIGMFYLLEYNEKIPSYKTKETFYKNDFIDSYPIEVEYTKTHEAVYVKMFDLIDTSSGDIMFEGIKKWHSVPEDFIIRLKVELEPKFYKKWQQKFTKANIILPQFFNDNTLVRCEISEDGNITKTGW